MKNLATVTHDDGTEWPSLAPLLPRLRLPWEYSVLGAILTGEGPDCRVNVLLRLFNGHYAVYRVDASDGSCHGDRYPGRDLQRAMEIFYEYVADRAGVVYAQRRAAG